MYQEWVGVQGSSIPQYLVLHTSGQPGIQNEHMHDFVN